MVIDGKVAETVPANSSDYPIKIASCFNHHYLQYHIRYHGFIFHP